jgi:DNA-binding XRE family transcriptional regulator
MSPAEELSKVIQTQRPNRNTKPLRKKVWDCYVRVKRERLYLTLSDVAEAVGITKSALSVIERGSDPLLTTAYALAVFFGCSVNELWKKPN